MTLNNNERAYLTLNRYADKCVKTMEEWASENELDSVTDELAQYQKLTGNRRWDFFFAGLSAYISGNESSRFEEMKLLFREFTADKIYDDEWYASVWAQELPQTWNYLWEEGCND